MLRTVQLFIPRLRMTMKVSTGKAQRRVTREIHPRRHHNVSWKKSPAAEYPGLQVNSRMMCRQSREDLSTLRLRGTSMFGIGFIRTAFNVETCMMKCALRCLSW